MTRRHLPERRRLTHRFRAMVSLGIVAALLSLAWWPVTTQQGIDGRVHAISIPLWVKVTEFLTRDYRYRRLVQQVTAGHRSDEGKVLALFDWTRQQLRPQPPGWPVIDDHVYSIIVRGYGTPDQFADVFATLCTYAGLPATVMRFDNVQGNRLYLAVVNMHNRWYPFDPYAGVYFQHADGSLASLQELAQQPWQLVTTRRGAPHVAVAYEQFIHSGVVVEPSVVRPYAHMPWHRLQQELQQWFGLRHVSIGGS